MPSNHTRNTNGLKSSSEAKTKKSLAKVDLAIRKLIKEQKVVNFNSVALAANVSKTFLYNNSDIRKQIETLRNQYKNPKLKNKTSMTESSKDVLLAAKNKRIRELENENKRIKQELRILRGMIYENEKYHCYTEQDIYEQTRKDRNKKNAMKNNFQLRE